LTGTSYQKDTWLSYRFDRAFVPLLQGEGEGEGEWSEDDDGEQLEEKKIISLYMNEHKLK
jgi:hypothetical protein